MRVLVLIVSLALAAGAMADDKKPKPKSTVKQLDKSSPMLMSGDSGNPDDSATAADAREKANRTKTRAQDYNSSRSNTTSLRGGPESDASDSGMGRSSERNKGQQGDRASGGKRQGGDYNGTRSNRSAAGRDYNSSRSNTSTAMPDRSDRDLGKENRCTIGRLDCDDDGDAIPATRTCGNGADDDCDSAVDEAPANHNTTRSNRTQPADRDNDRVVRKKPGKQ
jgi:hypothetical protein